MQAFGLAAYLLPALLAVLGAQLFARSWKTCLRAFAAVTLMLSLAVMLGLCCKTTPSQPRRLFGGFLWQRVA